MNGTETIVVYVEDRVTKPKLCTKDDLLPSAQPHTQTSTDATAAATIQVQEVNETVRCLLSTFSRGS